MGLGYVCLPLAEAFSRLLRTIRYRRNQQAIDELNATPGNKIEATTDPTQIKHADFVIIAVPTPVTKAKDPDLGAGEICVKDRRAEPEEWCHLGPEVHVLSRGNRRDHGANH